MSVARARGTTPLIAAIGVVAITTGCLLLGYEPIGGDPDNLYRPIKAELGRTLREGRLPFWSDRFGLGAPLVAESHVAAFYPLNWLLYGAFGVSTAYRLEMWLHMVATALTTFGYARALGLTPWGSAMSAVAFALCGFQSSHACHEPFYTAIPYLPLLLMLAERYLAAGGVWRLACLALGLGAQIALGHFQIPMWTCGLVALTALFRVWSHPVKWRRAIGLLLALGWGFGVAAVQLGLTLELMRQTSFNRPIQYLTNYSFPPSHWAQLVLPKLFMGFRDGPMADHWAKEATSADEACLYVGTVPLILACAGFLARADRSLRPWRLLAPLGLLLAVFPRLWLEGFELLLSVPGLNLFRAPGRYTLLTCLGLALLAGRGLDGALSARRFWAGYVTAMLLGACGFTWGVEWAARPDVAAELGGNGGRDYLIAGGIAWILGLAATYAWRRRRAPVWTGVVLALASVELGLLYHSGTTRWGWAISLPAESPILQRLLAEKDVGLIAGEIHSLPVRVGLTPAYPYLSIFPPPPNYLLEDCELASKFKAGLLPWLERSGVTHGIFPSGPLFRPADVLHDGPDPALESILPKEGEDRRKSRSFRLERYPVSNPHARVARTARVAEDWYELYPALSALNDPDQVWFLAADVPPASGNPRARNARVASWDGLRGEVEHDGEVDLVIRRTYYPGWSAKLDDGRPLKITPVEGGYQSVRLSGAGRSRVEFQYAPVPLRRFGPVSVASVVAAALVLLFSSRSRSTANPATVEKSPPRGAPPC